MTENNFPDVTPEPTSFFTTYAERETCPDCGDLAYKTPKRGGTYSIVCRNCRYGQYELSKKSNYGADWQKVREWILDRDGHECRKCGGAGELHVHHVEKLIWHETTAEAHRPENLTTLCKDCHKEVEPGI